MTTWLASSLLPLAALGLSILAGCDNNVIVEDGGGGSGAGTGGTSGDGGAGGAGAGDACSGFADASGTGDVMIRFRNDDAVTIYLPGNCSTAAFGLTPASATEATYPFEGTCLQTCEDLQTEEPFVCDACAPLMYRLEPGDVLEVRWDGTGLASRDMPQACFFSDFGPGPSCSQIVSAPAGDYAVEILGYSDCGEDCICEETGQCYGFGSGQSASPQAAILSYPGATSVDVVFPPCTFGCPPEPGGN